MLFTFTLPVCFLKLTNLEILLNYLMQQLQILVNQNWKIPSLI